MNTSFDREFSLPELLPPAPLAGLGGNLVKLLGAPLAVLDAGGRTLWGEAPPAASRYPLVTELEPLGYLATTAAPQQASAAARLLVELLMTRRRYLMASYLHTEAIATDHAELQRRGTALLSTEEKLQELAATFDTRVKEQASAAEQSQRQVFLTEKLASVAQLAAGTAHEINNPLGFVRSNLSTLGNYLAKIGRLRERLAQAPTAWSELDLDFVLADGMDLLKDCTDGLDRIARIVGALKGFSNIDHPDESIVDINEGLRAACAMVAHEKPAGVSLILDTEKLPPILCLPGHLNQVFLNVLQNALQAVGANGEIRVESRLERAPEDAQRIVVRIRDNGVGIDPHDLPRVFDPFFTTRQVGHGTGLGLTVARDIVQVHEGDLVIDSTPGQGTLVTIRLPA